MKFHQSLLLSVIYFGASVNYASDINNNSLIGEEYEVSPEELDRRFSESDHQSMLTKFSSEISLEKNESLADRMAADADLVIIGTIIAQSYTYDDLNVPSAHTSVLILNKLKGDYSLSEITLIQQGGPSKDGDRGYMVSGTHHFSLGDEELLFLKIEADDTFSINSRYRIYEEQLYDKDGFGLLINSEGTSVRLSKNRHPGTSFAEIDMGTHVLTKEFSTDIEDDSVSDSTGQGNIVNSHSQQDDYINAIHIDNFINKFSQ
jgi:hypothetical protein